MLTIQELEYAIEYHLQELEYASKELAAARQILAEERLLEQNAERARKLIFLTCFGVSVVTMALKWWN
jgi:hypothetical protein